MSYLKERYQDKNTLKVVFIIVSIVYCITIIGLIVSHNLRIDKLEKTTWAIDRSSGAVIQLKNSIYTIEDRLIEYKSHVRSFLKLFYQFDEYTFLDNMKEAENYMASESFEIELNKYRKDKILERIQEDDLILSIGIKKLEVKYSNNTPIGEFTIVQSYRRGESVKKRIIEGQFKIKDTEGRSSKIPHACLMYDYIILRKENVK